MPAFWVSLIAWRRQQVSQGRHLIPVPFLPKSRILAPGHRSSVRSGKPCQPRCSAEQREGGREEGREIDRTDRPPGVHEYSSQCAVGDGCGQHSPYMIGTHDRPTERSTTSWLASERDLHGRRLARGVVFPLQKFEASISAPSNPLTSPLFSQPSCMFPHSPPHTRTDCRLLP